MVLQVCRSELWEHHALATLLKISLKALSDLLKGQPMSKPPADQLAPRGVAALAEEDLQRLLGVLELLAADAGDVSSPGGRQVCPAPRMPAAALCPSCLSLCSHAKMES